MAEEVKMVRRKESSPPAPLSRKVMVLTTAAILLGNVTFGCSLTAFFPALESMRLKYKTGIDDISIVFPIMTIMYCLGAIICGFISKYLNRQVITIGSLMGLAIAMYATPHSPTKTVFFVIGGLLGFSSGFYDSSQMVWIIEIWQEESGPFIQAQHFCYAFGTTIPALILAQFLNSNKAATESPQESLVEEESRMLIPFTILGALNSLAFVFQVCLFVFYRYHTPPMYANEDFKGINDANKIASHMEVEVNENEEQPNFSVLGTTVRKVKLIAITGMFLGAYAGMEVSTMQFIPLIGQYSDLKMSESASAYVLTGLTAMFAVGRAIGIIIIFKVKPEIIIGINCVCVVIANFILLIWANHNLTMYWFGSMLLGLGYSTMFPSFCAFMEKYLVFTSAIASFIIVVGTITASIYPLILARIIEQNAVVLTYTNFFSIIISIIAMSWGYTLTRKSTKRER